jgi:hypothetical protein
VGTRDNQKPHSKRNRCTTDKAPSKNTKPSIRKPVAVPDKGAMRSYPSVAGEIVILKPIINNKTMDAHDYEGLKTQIRQPGYVELDFTAAAAGNGFGCYYGNTAYDSNPDDTGRVRSRSSDRQALNTNCRPHEANRILNSL